ncbi:MAG: hypothetical protein KAT37_04275, partial [Candidatus Aenigmarchaeota archaeon]|nr:hypothetical protein [Candidatus Aenigmarchaeota archaeon]
MKILKHISILLTVFLVITIFVIYGQQSMTGLFVPKGEQYTQELNLKIEEAGNYTWIPEEYQKYSNLTFIKANGYISGNVTGYARVYLVSKDKRYIILNHTLGTDESGFGVTGYATGNESEEITTTEITVETTSTAEETSTIETTSTIEEITTTVPETTTTQETTTTTENQTTTTQETTSTVNTTTTIPYNQTTTTIEENVTTTVNTTTTIPENQTTTIVNTTSTVTTTVLEITVNTTTTILENITESIIVYFEDKCIETCDLTVENLIDSSYKLEFELSDDVVLYISTLKYGLQSPEQNITEELNITEEELTQEQAEIGKPVKWTKRIELEKVEPEVRVKIHKQAENIKVTKLAPETEKVNPRNVKVKLKNKLVPIADAGITGYITGDNETTTTQETTSTIEETTTISETTTTQDTTTTEESSTTTVNTTTTISDNQTTTTIEENLTTTVNTTSTTQETTTTIDNEDEETEEMELLIEQEGKEFLIEYETPGPQKQEKQITPYRKQITIYSSVHYENIIAYTDLPEIVPIGKESAIKLYRLTNETKELVTELNYSDENNNSLIDKIQWIVPHLSNETYEVDITILNPYTYVRDGEIWTVAFNTTGEANLTISSPNANWIEMLTDLNETIDEMFFLYLNCSKTSLEDQLKIIDFSNDTYNYTDITENDSIKPKEFLIENYSCEDTSYISNFMYIAGYAILKFQFGDQIAYAYDAGSNITWEDPTPEDGNLTTNNWVYLNTTINNTLNTSAFFDWNYSLIGYWSFDYNNSTGIFDNSTYQNFGTFYGNNFGQDNLTTGKYGNALDFDGSDDYINCSNDS